jgi:hypothetical protein
MLSRRASPLKIVMPDKTKAQHYVPQFYLNRFAVNGQVAVFDNWLRD